MEKFCVFCGNKPEKKNKEHVIPKWLIKLTGDENRTISLGLNFYEFLDDEKTDIQNRLYSFKHFQFPACTKCNTDYAEFEGKASRIIRKILEDEFITSSELNHLLDWFDKVRIGLWLGSITLDQIKEDVNPKFYINNRIGEKDRALYVYKLADKEKGLNFHGFNSPGFQFAPCIFGFRINNYYFINYSKDYLLARNLGFPFFEHSEYIENSRAEFFRPNKGTNQINTPILRTDFPRPTMCFYQSILVKEEIPPEYINDYVLENLSNERNNRSLIFYYDSFEKKINKLEDDMEIIIDGRIINQRIYKFNNVITKAVLNEIEKLLMFNEHMKSENKERRLIVENNRKNILKFHRTIKKFLFEIMDRDYS